MDRATNHSGHSKRESIDTSVYQFHEFTFDAAAYRLTRDGEAVPLEPLVAELLVLLIAHRERVVDRAELLDRLWPQQVVSDSALSRLVYALRRVLDDDAVAPRFIRTVPRRGLQFVAPVLECEPASSAEVAPEVADEPRSNAAVPPVSSHQRKLAGALLVVVTVIASLVWLANRTPEEPAALGRVVLLGGLAPGADAEGQLALLAVSDMLWLRLSERPDLAVRSPLTTPFQEADASTAAFARENAADSVLALRIGRSTATDAYALTAELIQFSGEESLVTPLGSFQLPSLAADPGLQAFRDVRDRIVARLIEDARGLLAAADRAETASSEAWRLYLLARERLYELTCGADDARALLERAVEIDPEFALAWVALGYAHYNAVWACDGGREEAELALAAASRARALDGGLDLAVFLEVSLQAELGSADRGVEIARAHLASAKRSAIGQVALAYALTYRGAIAEAARGLDRAVALDPLVLARETGLVPTAYLHLERFDRFLEIVPVRASAVGRFYAALAELKAGRPDHASGLLADMNEPLPRDRFKRFGRVLRLLLEGEAEDADPLLELLIAQRQRPDVIDGEMDYKLAQLLALAGRDDDARAALMLAEARGFRCPECVARDPDLARLGSP